MNARAALVGVLLLAPALAHAGNTHPSDLEAAGDTLQVGVPLFALGLTFLFEGGDDGVEEEEGRLRGWGPVARGLDAGWVRMNGSPRHDLMLAIGRTELATYSLKYAVDEQRPNGHGESFPSGHTSVAFAGAEFIRKQYGWGWGLPAYVSASVVGWSRVEAGKHWTHDVLAGAAIGILSNHDGLSFDLPFRWGALSIAPTLAPGFAPSPFAAADPFRDVPADSIQESMERPAATLGAGLRLEARF